MKGSADASHQAKVYLLDDDDEFRLLLERWLALAELEVESFSDASVFLKQADSLSPGVLLLDLRMPGLDGFDVMEALREREIELPVIVTTASDKAQDAFRALHLGAYDYLVKPVEKDHLLSRVRNAAERLDLQQKVVRLEHALQEHQTFQEIIGAAAPMKKVFKDIRKVAPSSIPIYVHGESGTGKELAARAIHRESRRKEEPFIAINCAAIPEHLLESELFGHEKGAFTGAIGLRKGCFERAHGGTLFLDEIGELDLANQVKLLRVLQEGCLVRLGGSREIKVDVRIICATNRDLEEQISLRQFREDLFYRIAAFTLQLPPLRERIEDIPLLVQHFFEKYKHEASPELEGFAADTIDMMLQHNWPGNVRELENVVRSAMVVGDPPKITCEALPHRFHRAVPHQQMPTPARQAVQTPTPSNPMQTNMSTQQSLPSSPAEEAPIVPLAEVEKQAILQALRRTCGNIERAAALLEVGRATIYRRIDSYEDVDLSEFKRLRLVGNG